MAKQKGKRKKANAKKLETFQSLSNLTGLVGTSASDTGTLEACLAEFQPESSSSQNIQQLDKDSTCKKPSSFVWKDCIDLDRIEAWNRSFLAWIHGGRYEPGLLPNIDQELARNFKSQELSSFLLKSAGNTDLRMPVFERWLLDSKFEERTNNPKSVQDPVFPMSSSPTSSPSTRLYEELIQNNGQDSITKASELVAELCRKANLASQTIACQSERYSRQSPLKKGDRMIKEETTTTSISLLYSRKKWKKPFVFRLNRSHYKKLKERFFRIHNMTTTKLKETSEKTMCGFHVLVLSILLRYSALSGGQLLQDLRGGGMQGAIHEQVFDVLQTHFPAHEEAWLEGFGSPFNVCLDTFGSAFPDTDWHFGCIGNFMDCSFQRRGGCCCEVNPPFSPGIMNGMVDKMETELCRAEENSVSLTFVVIVPTVRTSTSSSSSSSSSSGGVTAKAMESASVSFHRMLTSRYCVKHIELAAREHGFVEGAQHLRPTKYKQSSYATSVILLQSPRTDDNRKDVTRMLNHLERDIKEAFSPRNEEEIEQRRMKRIKV